MNDDYYMHFAIEMANMSIEHGGGPFGAIIVDCNGTIISASHNQVTLLNDPTAHAEILCIRDACKKLKTFALDYYTIYTSCEPCPMCAAAIHWSRISRVVYANTRHDAADIGFDDQKFYDELHTPSNPFIHCASKRDDALETFKKWQEKQDKIHY